jgi:pantoate--beta-alanine ligase
MEQVTEPEAIRSRLLAACRDGRTVGLVPTMGYFHDGHLALMRAARRDCDLVVTSIFVNPLQFGPGEDFGDYPRDLQRDREAAAQVDVDLLFCPAVETMYPEGFATFVRVERLTEVLCGRFRPGHFQGVATVVAKLFNLVPADFAYFGEKDAQQALVIKRMVRDLNFPIRVITVPTVREIDGLAMSSRNIYLSEAQRRAAPVLYQSLLEAKEAMERGERSGEALCHMVKRRIAREPEARLQYVEVRGLPDLEELTEVNKPALLAVAAYFGKARLIDNVILDPTGRVKSLNDV